MSSKKPANSQSNSPKRPGQPLANPTGPRGNIVSGDAKAVSPKDPAPKTTPKAKASTPTAATPAASPKTPTTSASPTGVQNTLEQAKQAVEQFAQVSATQAHALGVQLADAEAAFPLTMMQGYQARKAELSVSGADASSFLSGLTAEVSALRETSVTITLPSDTLPSNTLATNDGTALLSGTKPAT